MLPIPRFSATLSSRPTHLLAVHFFLLIFFIINASVTAQQQVKDDQLENYLKSNSIQDAKAHLAKKLESLSSYSPDQQAYFLNRSSQVSLIEGSFQEGLAHAKNAALALKNQPGSALWGETYRAICFAYIRNAKLDSALTYAEKLYEFTKVNQDLGMRRAALLALGNISLQNKSYQQSLDFYTDALEITEKQKDSINLKVDYYNVGLALAQLNEHQKSEEYLLKAAVRAEKEQAWDLLARTYGTLADNYIDQKKYEIQIEYLKKANDIAEKIGNTQLLAMGYANLSESALRLKHYNQAIDWGNQSKELLSEKPLPQLEAKVDSMLYVAHKKTGNFEIALNKLESYDEMKLKIRNQAQKEKLEQLTLQFESEKKDILIENQRISLEEEKAKNRVFVLSLVFLVALIFFFSFISIKNAQKRKFLFQKEKELDQVIQLEKSVSQLYSQPISKAEQIEPEEKDDQTLFQELMQEIQKKKLYLDTKLNQQTLVNEFGTNRQYLYEAISKNGEDNFRGLINRFRVNESKELIKIALIEKTTVEISTLYERVGFNSYPTFYRSFKSITGLTPNEYVKELKEDLAKENLIGKLDSLS